MPDREKLPFEGLLGTGENYDTNLLRGLLGMAIGSLQGNTTAEALSSGLAHGLHGVDAGRRAQGERDYRRFQMARPIDIDPYQQRAEYNQRTGRYENVGTPARKPYSARDLVETVGPDGRPRYTPASSAVGQPAYTKPPAPLTSGNYVKTTGPDGSPRYLSADKAAGAPAYVEPKTLTPVQAANVSEIRNARTVLSQWEKQAEREGVSLTEYMNRRASKTNPYTGQPEVDYSSDAYRLGRAATQTVPGQDDEEARQWMQKLYGVSSPTQRRAEDSSMSKPAPRANGVKAGAKISIGGQSYTVVKKNMDGTVTIRGADGVERRARESK